MYYLSLDHLDLSSLVDSIGRLVCMRETNTVLKHKKSIPGFVPILQKSAIFNQILNVSCRN